MKISYIQDDNLKSTETRISYNLIQKFNERGIDVTINAWDEDCKIILSVNGLGAYDIYEDIINKIKEVDKSRDVNLSLLNNIKTIMYVWDMYPWTNYITGYDSLKEYNEIWVPSNEVILRLNEFYDIDPSKCKVIKSYAELFEADNIEVKNNNFVYHPVRKYNDPNYGFTERACEELNIPYVRSNHSLNYEEYKKTVLNCSFLVTEYMEASTGGLTLLEGYKHGKDILISNSIYQGAKDYFGHRAYYFKDGDFEDFKSKIKMLYEQSLNYKLTDEDFNERKKYIIDNFTIDVMVDNIISRLNELNG
jgi:hypothetical protein